MSKNFTKVAWGENQNKSSSVISVHHTSIHIHTSITKNKIQSVHFLKVS